jgi:Pyridoxamine 5'-phosphate oxidase
VAKQFTGIEPAHREFILRQKIFFNASAASTGRVNVSPRDVASLRVIDRNNVLYLDLTGSGNETAAHLRADGRLTLMFCAFEGAPMILRLYGKGRIAPRGSPEYRAILTQEFADNEPPGARQIVVLDVDLVQTSCGYGVPLFEYAGERQTLTRWAEAKGEAELEEYRRQKNSVSIDGLPTGLFEEATADLS